MLIGSCDHVETSALGLFGVKTFALRSNVFPFARVVLASEALPMHGEFPNAGHDGYAMKVELRFSVFGLP